MYTVTSFFPFFFFLFLFTASLTDVLTQMAWMSANVNFFPASLPHDAMFDLICVDGTVGRMKALKMITAAETGAHFEMPHVRPPHNPLSPMRFC